MTNGKSIKEILQNGIQKLTDAGIENSVFDARAFLCEILDKDAIYLDIYKDDILPHENVDLYESYISRRCKNEPYAYIVNNKEFMSLDFYVDKNVLIPRPDTEILVEKVIDICNKNNNILSIADLCTGSGALAVSIAHYVKSSKITAVDISIDALDIAQKNAVSNRVEKQITFKKCDVLGDISNIGTFDIIVSNPPYIKKKDIDTLESNVKDFEPLLALDGGGDGLDFYRNIIHHSDKMLSDDGILAFEIGFDQANDVVTLLNNKFRSVEVIKDYSGNDRVVVAYR